MMWLLIQGSRRNSVAILQFCSASQSFSLLLVSKLQKLCQHPKRYGHKWIEEHGGGDGSWVECSLFLKVIVIQLHILYRVFLKCTLEVMAWSITMLLSSFYFNKRYFYLYKKSCQLFGVMAGVTLAIHLTFFTSFCFKSRSHLDLPLVFKCAL